MSGMRWLFWILLLANAVAVYWFASAAEHRHESAALQKQKATTALLKKGVATLVLLKEQKPVHGDGENLDIGAEESNNPGPAEAVLEEAPERSKSAAPESSEDTERQCRLIGPFSSTREVLRWQQQLREREVPLWMVQREEVASEDYWIIVPPRPTREAADKMLEELREKHVDSFIIANGEYMNGITLGVFSERENTDNYRQQLNEMGVEVEIVPRPRVEVRSWIEVPAAAEYLPVLENLRSESPGEQDFLFSQDVAPCDQED